MFERIISRLIDNAILYTEKGEITVSANLKKENNKHLLEISVKDTGFGLTQENKQNLFQLFYRGKEAIFAHPNGSGLGLFIVKSLVEALQGTIKAQSVGQNKGTTLTLALVQEV